MTIFDRGRDLASAALATYGTPATITTGTSTTNRLTGAVTPGAGTSKAVRAILKPRKITSDDGTTTSALTAILNASAIPGDTLAINGASYTVEDVTETNPDAGVPLIWTVTLS